MLTKWDLLGGIVLVLGCISSGMIVTYYFIKSTHIAYCFGVVMQCFACLVPYWIRYRNYLKKSKQFLKDLEISRERIDKIYRKEMGFDESQIYRD